MIKTTKFRAYDIYETGAFTEIIYQEGKEFLEYFLDLDNSEKEYGCLFQLTQFTGMKDENDKEIYEGDIVKDFDGKIYEVIWDRFMFNLKGYYNQSSDYPTIAFSEGVYEIVGNIFENNNLLQ